MTRAASSEPSTPSRPSGAQAARRSDLRAPGSATARRLAAAAALACVTFVLAFAPSPAGADTGDLVQQAGTLGCVTNDGADSNGTPGLCAVGRALRPNSVVVSPDGKHAYTGGQGLAVFDRDAATGALTQKTGPDGCFTASGNGGACGTGPGVASGEATISPDGKYVYLTGGGGGTLGGAVAVFERNATTGVLTQKTGPAGCVAEQGDGITCADARLHGAGANGGFTTLTVSPDGTSAYLTAGGQLQPSGELVKAVGTFDRDPATGVLTQKLGPAGCLTNSGSGGACATGGPLMGRPRETAVSPDGKHVYLTTPADPGPFAEVMIFDRAADGALAQKTGTAGCITAAPDATGGACAVGRAVDDPQGVTVSADGRNVYFATREGNGVAIYDRNATTGVLTQKAKPAGCLSTDTREGDCGVAAGLHRITHSIEISPDGKSAYVAVVTPIHGGAVVALNRNPATGVLSTKPGTQGCISLTGTSPAGDCRVGRAIAFATDVAISPDGKNVYVAAWGLTMFDRDLGDIIAGDTIIELGPTEGSTTGDSTPTFEFSSDGGATFECKVDAGAFASCTAPFTAAALSDGAHTFAVRATDAAFNVDPTPATRAFTVDTAAPETSIGSGPTGTTGEAKPTFALSSTEAGSTFECRVDAGAFARCGSPHTTAALADGAHTFEARATDPSGNADATPATRAFRVDTAAPQTTIDSGPTGRTTDMTPTFGFSSNAAGSTFECRVDEAEFAVCVSPHTTAALADGAHTLEVRATGPFGGADRSPARRSFTVDTAVAPVPAPPPAARGGPINGTPGADRLVGTPGNDVINCGGGNDVVVAGGGDDVINCGAGNDVIDAGPGNDRVAGGSGNDKITGGAGNDSLSGNAGDDRLSGNAGNDRLLGGAGRDRLLGGPGRDVLTGGGGLDVLSGGPGKDRERQ